MTENEDTRGMTLRELVLELRSGQVLLKDELQEGFSKRPTRTELAISATLISGVILGIVAL